MTTVKVHAGGGNLALLLPEVNPLVYTYGLAFDLIFQLGSLIFPPLVPVAAP